MGRPIGVTNKYWTADEEYNAIKPIIESKNGWLKKEMYLDFNQDDYENVDDYINAIIYDYNNY